MPKSLFPPAHRTVLGVLVDARREAGLLQVDLARMLGRDQSYVSNIERGQRRIDVVEFYDLARALGRDPAALFADIAARIANENAQDS